MMLDRSFLALDARTRRAFFVQTHADAFAAEPFLTELALDLDLAQPFSLDVGQLQIFEHQIDQFVQTDIGFVVVDAGPVAGLLAAFAVFTLTYYIAGLGLAVAALADAGSVLAVDEAVLFDAANGHFDDSIVVFADDRLFGDDVGNVVADRFAHFLPVAQTIAGAAVAALGGGRIVRAKDGVPRMT